MRSNAMKAKLQRGETALGCSVMFPSPQIVEMLGHAGFDWVLLDCEHGSLSLADVEVMAMAADAVGITAIARPRSNSAADIQSVMDRGVGGVQVPHVNSAEDARAAVNAVKFGPGAARGLAAGTRPDSWGLGARMSDFAAAANARSLVCVQIEHTRAVANIDEILGVAGIDVFFVGPSDLSQSMGHPGNPQAPEVAAAIETVLGRIRARGLTPGMPATAETLAGVRAAGCRYIYTHLPRLLGAGARAFLSA
ncbi:MAG: aldolase/citrate lyase family protein [Hyphomicrobiaceae bacterium]|nr:aldolase/citrate lyase family protein [Hyphomicrobiaceae bacterium]